MLKDLHFTDFQLDDYESIISFTNSVKPDEPINLEQTKSFDKKRSVKRVLVRQVSNSVSNQMSDLIAYYSYRKDDNSSKDGYVLKLIYDKSLLTSEALEIIYQHLFKRITTLNPEHLQIKVMECDLKLLELFNNHGFQELERMWPSTLYLDSFDKTVLKNLNALIQTHSSKGISYKRLADLPINEKTKRQFYDCTIACLQDVPTAEAISIWPFEVWKERFWSGPECVPETVFIAFDGDTLVAQTQLRPSPKEGNISTGLTGVIASHRGKGIAKVLKLIATNYAIENNYSTITTYNHSNNQPMLGINEAMGYVKSPALITLRKEIDSKL